MIVTGQIRDARALVICQKCDFLLIEQLTLIRTGYILKNMAEVTEETKEEVEGKEKVGNQESKNHLLKKLPKTGSKTILMVLGAFIVVLAGVGTGWLLSGQTVKGDSVPEKVVPGVESKPMEAGIADEETFRDSAEGILEEGGIEGEGTHHLVREGGPTKYVYLTSTVIDLEFFKGKTVMIWGETISARHAGWLMDVGKIKVIE